MSRRFVASCYIEDVTDKIIQGGIVEVHNYILKDLCTNEAKKVKDKFKEKTILEERLCKNQFLLVLDDIRDNDEVLDNPQNVDRGQHVHSHISKQACI